MGENEGYSDEIRKYTETSTERGEFSGYSPLVPLRRDFNVDNFTETAEGKDEINNPDLHTLMSFYRASIRPGSLIDIGAGATHLHYMTAIEDKLSSITALDLEPSNTKLLQELRASLGAGGAAGEWVSADDVEIFKRTARAIASDGRYGVGRTQERIVQNILGKTSHQGEPDIIK